MKLYAKGPFARTAGSLLLACAFACSPALGNGFGAIDKTTPNSSQGVVRIPLWTGDQVVKPADVTVSAEGRPLPVIGVLPPQAPTILFILFDITASSGAAVEMQSALDAELVNLPPAYWVGLMTSADGFRILQDPTQDRSALRWQVNAIYPMGHPGLLDSLLEVETIATRVLRRGGVRVAVLCITDSNVTDYQANYGNQAINSSDTHDMSRRFAGRDLEAKILRLDRKLRPEQAPLFLVQTVNREDGLNRQYRSGLDQLCDSLGGSLWVARTRAEISAHLHSAFERIRGFYLVTVRGAPRGKQLQLTVSIRDNSALTAALEWRKIVEAEIPPPAR